jgi:hypothetical protein
MFEFITIFLAGICTLAIYSFLYKENIFYRIFEHLFIGIAAGWGFVVTIRQFLWPKFFGPLFGDNIVRLPDNSIVVEYDYWILWYLIPAFFSTFYYFIYSTKYKHLVYLVISFQFGCVGGYAFKGFFVEVLPQIYDCFKAVLVNTPTGISVDWSNLIFILTLLTSFSYFFFTFKISENKIFNSSRTVGRLMMMVCFGAFFGSTMMARMALLVERITFLSDDWLNSIVEISRQLV